MVDEKHERQSALARSLESARSTRAEGQFSGRGLVICAGGPTLFTNAYLLIHVLRNQHHCRLPIEVWHYGPAELSPRMRSLLHELDVETIDAIEQLARAPAQIRDGWQLKAYAVMHSRFKEVLLLDADNVPTRDPACVFDWPEYQQTGAVLWPDVIDLLKRNPIWDSCGLEPRAVTSIESGQVLIDKTRCWAALHVILHLNENADYYYRMIHGDKETWLLGLLLTETPYAMIPQQPACDGARCLFQRDFNGDILFQHRTGAKWRYAGEQTSVQNFSGLAECMTALTQLRALWNGIVFLAPPRSEQAIQNEDDISRIEKFVLLVSGEQPTSLHLMKNGEIGRSSRTNLLNWHCETGSGDEEYLVFWDAFGPLWRFQKDLSGRWTNATLEEGTATAWLCESDKVTASFMTSPAANKTPRLLNMDNFYSRSALLAEAISFDVNDEGRA